MALGDIAGDLSGIVASLPIEASDKILGLILVLKTLGIMAIIYVVYVIVMGVFTYRKMKKLGYIEEKVNSIDKKLNRLLKGKKK